MKDNKIQTIEQQIDELFERYDEYCERVDSERQFPDSEDYKDIRESFRSLLDSKVREARLKQADDDLYLIRTLRTLSDRPSAVKILKERIAALTNPNKENE